MYKYDRYSITADFIASRKHAFVCVDKPLNQSNSSLILIPPSEGKRPGGAGAPIQPDADAREMIERLLHFEGDWSKLLGVKGKALEEAIAANQAIMEAPTLPAIERYSGVVYDGIDYPSLSKPGKRRFDRHVRIVSALFGLVKPQDAIPNYKLKIDKLNAAAHWKSALERALASGFVIDLLPQAHRKAVKYTTGIAVDFYVEKQGKRVSAGHNGKWIKGRFVRWLCENGVQKPEAFGDFTEDGYLWTGEHFLKRK